ncbi:acyl-CoA synthetase [Mycolicibacterium conceptionense]|uniref:Acyl-CoA synthetase n=1 Tax=Mycolicibacterium conceptionense TaxID=451644 RepID=A0A0U1DYW9_9MYCO|nr:acyl-CoA synthetase [Mycolicibacterium conceptionense]
MIAASVDHLADAVELALTAHAPAQLVAFDHHAEIDDHRDAVASATEKLAGAGVQVETLSELLNRGKDLPTPPVPESDGTDPLALLIYTSGSTGAPKGAMYLQSSVAKFWRRNSKAWLGPVSSAINLSFMPMST